MDGLGVGAFSRAAASSVAGRFLRGRGAVALWVAYPVLNRSDGPAARATAQMYGGREAARIESAIKCRAAERRDPQNVARSVLLCVYGGNATTAISSATTWRCA